MKTSLLILLGLPCVLFAAGCVGNTSATDTPSASAEQPLRFRTPTAQTTLTPQSAIVQLVPPPSDVLVVDAPVPRLVPTTVVIDDFTVGQAPQNLIDWDQVTYQAGPTANIVGGVRQSYLNVKSSQRATLLDIPTGGPMFIDSNWHSYWAADLQYGFGEEGPRPLDLSLTGGYDRFRVSFEALDAAVDYSISVADGDGNRAYSEGIRSTSSSNLPFYTDFLFRDLHGSEALNWADIDAIYLSFYTVSPAGGSDVALTSIVVQ